MTKHYNSSVMRAYNITLPKAAVVVCMNCTTFLHLQDFQLPLALQAHLHHYLNVEGMEADMFQASIESLTSLVAEYETLQSSIGTCPDYAPRLKIC